VGHKTRLAGLYVAILWAGMVILGTIWLLSLHQYDGLIFASVINMITLVLLLVYLWDSIRIAGYTNVDMRRYKSEVDFLSGKLGDLEYERRIMYGVFKAREGTQRGELVSLHEVLFAAKAECRLMNQRTGGKLGVSMAYEVYTLQVNIRGDVGVA
jgi:hypothetical protein